MVERGNLTTVGATVAAQSPAELPSRVRSLWLEALRRLARDPAAVIGLALFALLLFVALFSPYLPIADPTAVSVRDRLQPPLGKYWLGTDELGRDIGSRLLWGARSSFSVGVVAVGIALIIGVGLGLLGGFYGGLTDSVIMRALDALLAFPGILLALAIVSVIGPNLFNVMVAIGVVSIPAYARITRGSVLSLREKEFVEAARAAGARDGYVMSQVILPNCLSPLLVQASIGFANAILAEAALSFLGVGLQPPLPSWGAMLDVGRKYLGQSAWYSFSAGAAIFIAVLSLNLLGDGLRDALDPRLSANQN